MRDKCAVRAAPRVDILPNCYSRTLLKRTILVPKPRRPNGRPDGLRTDMSKPSSILIVDDEPNILLSLQFLMKKSGYEVRTAKDGEEALAEISRAAPDLILLDVMMPKIDGFSVCERIRSNPQWSGVRIIMLTARGRDVEREKGLALGADDYITKPFSTHDAIARVEAVLAKSKKPEGA